MAEYRCIWVVSGPSRASSLCSSLPPAALAGDSHAPRARRHGPEICAQDQESVSTVSIARNLHSGIIVQTMNSFAYDLFRKRNPPTPSCIDNSHRQQASFLQCLCSFDVCFFGALAFAFIVILLIDLPSSEQAVPR